MVLAAAAEVTRSSDFNPFRENLGMFVVGVIITVVWLAFRHMLKLSEQNKTK